MHAESSQLANCSLTGQKGKNGSVNGNFVQQQDWDLAVEHYHEPHLKSLQYDMNIHEPLRDPTVITSARKLTRVPHAHYCYSSALQMVTSTITD